MTERVRGGGAAWARGLGGGRRGGVAGALGAATVALAPAAARAEGPDRVAVLAPSSASLGPGTIESTARPAGPAAAPERDGVGADDKKYEGLLGPVRPGVTAALAPLPQGLYGIEVGAKYKRWVGGGLQYSTMPTIEIGGASAGLSTFTLNGRFHPFRGGFFVGAGLGRTAVFAEATDQGQTARVEASRTFVSPGIGWLYTLPSGLTIGFLNVGVSVPLASSAKTELPPMAAIFQPDLAQRANDVARPLGRQVLPSVELLRVGYML